MSVRVLVFGTYDVRSHPRVGILADGLRRRGLDVAECNVPLGLDTAERVEILKRPALLPTLLVRLVRCWYALARQARRQPRPDVVLVGYLGHFDVLLAKLLFRRTPIVLDHLIFAADTARDRGETGGLKLALLRVVDRMALRSADVIVVDTEEHRELVPDRYRDRAVVAAVGAADEWFEVARPADEVSGDRLRVVFFGVYTPLHGTPVIGHALTELAGESIDVTMIGSGQDDAETRAAARANDRVTWVDWVAPDELPKVVADHDVCLGVFGTTMKALNVVPNKVFQGAAAGCAVVTSGTSPQRRTLGTAALFVPPGDSAALASALRRLAWDSRYLTRMRTAAARLAVERFAPDQIVGPLLDHLQDHLHTVTKARDSS
ncbi:glycosyltransferase [Actinopolymorpha sp. B17G11]|uniref:glycosyltransferase n=1 Tax=Actinopolymorpha sp. B17G11 TaxID=3160861 RepID=UPI0032E3EDBD